MGRTPDAKNRTPREIETAGKNLLKEARLRRQIEALKKKK
jgi:hypothetical protein